MRKALLYGTTLIAIYLVVAYGTNSGTLVTNSATGAANVIKAFQGR